MPTREELRTQFSLDEAQVKKTLKAAGLRLKKNYSDSEAECFRQAREMLTEQTKTYEEVKAYFASLNSTKKDSLEEVEQLNQAAIKAGVLLGGRQGELMASIIPKAAMMTLMQKIESGAIDAAFEKYLAEMGTVGKEELEAQVVEVWNQTYLEGSKSQMSLPESSTPSSDSDS